MGIFGKKKTSEVVQELLTLKSKISELPQKYPTGTFTFGTGVAQAQEQIPTICRNIDEAIRALDIGVDPYDRPITKSQIADGLIRLVNATRKPAFVGLMIAVLSSEGVLVLETYMNELEQIASTIAGTVAEQKYAPAKGGGKVKREKKGTINYCPKCGSPVKEGSLFCENCGYELSKEKKISKPEDKKRKLTPLGYVIGIGGMLLALFSYFFLGVDRYFYDLHGTLGLSDIFWAIIGGMIWIFIIMAILTPVALKLGTK